MDDTTAGHDVKNSSLAPAVTRSIQILDLLAEAAGEPLTLADIARAIGAAKSSTSNLLVVLEEGRMIQRRAQGFVLGRHIVELGGAYLNGFDQVREFYRLCDESPVLRSELTQVAILIDTDVLYLARHEGRAPMRISARIGDRFPAALTAVGNALLARLDDEAVSEIYASYAFPRWTGRSTRDLPTLLKKLQETRKRGYATDDGGVNSGVFGIATTVTPLTAGDKHLSVGASLLRDGLEKHRVLEVAHALTELAQQLSNPLAMND